MKTTFFILFALFCFGSAKSQSVSPEVYSTSGDYFTGTNATLSWTIGESVIETYSGSNAIITQGFQQSSYSVTSIEEAPDNEYQISVYPNPASRTLTLSVGVDEMPEIISAEIIDLQGKVLFHQEIKENTTQIDLNHFASSTYFLKITGKDGKLLKSFRIQKIN